MPETFDLVLVSIGVVAMVMNMIGLVIAFLANQKFLPGMHKRVVTLVLILVVFLNVQISIEVLNHAALYLRNDILLSYSLSQVSILFVIIVCIFTSIASYVNYRMGSEVGFK